MSEHSIVSFRLNEQDAEHMQQLTTFFGKSKSAVLRFLLRSASEQLCNDSVAKLENEGAENEPANA